MLARAGRNAAPRSFGGRLSASDFTTLFMARRGLDCGSRHANADHYRARQSCVGDARTRNWSGQLPLGRARRRIEREERRAKPHDRPIRRNRRTPDRLRFAPEGLSVTVERHEPVNAVSGVRSGDHDSGLRDGIDPLSSLLSGGPRLERWSDRPPQVATHLVASDARPSGGAAIVPTLGYRHGALGKGKRDGAAPRGRILRWGGCRSTAGWANVIVLPSSSSRPHLNQAQVEACLAELQNWKCDELKPGVCNQVFAGSVAPGGPCTHSEFDCAPATDGFASCQHKGGESICKVTPDPAPGQRCGKAADTPTEHFECTRDVGLYCDAASQTCQPRFGAGEPCDSDNQCLRGLGCDSSTQKCLALTPVGSDCMSRACVETAYCDPSSHVCTAKKPPGSSCTSDSECVSGCDPATNACDRTLYSCFPKK